MPALWVSALALRLSRRSRHRYSLSQEKIRSHLSFCFRSFLPNSGRGAFRFCCGCTSHHSADWGVSHFVCGAFRGNGAGRAIFSALPSAVFSAAFHGNTARPLQWYSGNDKRSASPKPLPRWSASAADAGRISRFLRRSFHSGTDLRRACRHAHIKKDYLKGKCTNALFSSLSFFCSIRFFIHTHKKKFLRFFRSQKPLLRSLFSGFCQACFSSRCFAMQFLTEDKGNHLPIRSS